MSVVRPIESPRPAASLPPIENLLPEASEPAINVVTPTAMFLMCDAVIRLLDSVGACSLPDAIRVASKYNHTAFVNTATAWKTAYDKVLPQTNRLKRSVLHELRLPLPPLAAPKVYYTLLQESWSAAEVNYRAAQLDELLSQHQTKDEPDSKTGPSSLTPACKRARHDGEQTAQPHRLVRLQIRARSEPDKRA